MCNKRNFIPVWIPHLKAYRYVDECISDLIEELNEKGIKTFGSCCGHGKYPITIVLRHGFVLTDSTMGYIQRKRNFYKKDEKGFYFIPEVIKNGFGKK